jgi:hypothetical protein
MTAPKEFGHHIIDKGLGPSGGLFCSCGTELHPDCDVSSVSIGQAWEQHLEVAHGK